MEYDVEVNFDFGKEPKTEIEALEKKLGIEASYKGKLEYIDPSGKIDYLVRYTNLQKKQALRIIDAFSELNDLRFIQLERLKKE